MAGRITEYANSRTTFVDGDLFDVSAFLNPGYESQKTTWLDFKNNLNSAGYLTSVDLSYTASTRTVGNTGGNDAVLPLFTDTEAGLVPLSGGGTTNFLRADGTWAAAFGDNFATADLSLTATRTHSLSGFSAIFQGSNQSFQITAAGYLLNSGAGAANSGTVFGDNAGKDLTTATFSTFFGYYAGANVTTGAGNSLFGGNSGTAINTGLFNTGLGYIALKSLTSGDSNVAVGVASLELITTSSQNIAVGRNAGKLLNIAGNLTTADNSVFLGYDTRANANGETNQIVVGYAARGNGSNTATWGNTSIANHYFTGKLNVNGDAQIDGDLNLTPVSAASVATPTTGGSLFIDSADGALKIKFSTGNTAPIQAQV